MKRTKTTTLPLYPLTDEQLKAEVRLLAAEVRAGNESAEKVMLERAEKYADYEQRVRQIWKKLRPRGRNGRFAKPAITDFTVGSWPFRR